MTTRNPTRRKRRRSPVNVSDVGIGGQPKADLAALRRNKIDALLRESLDKQDPLQANLGVMSSDLMLLGTHLQEAINGALATTKDPLDKFGKLIPAIESYLKITRQVDRLARLDHQLVKKLAAAAKSQAGDEKEATEELEM